jgi:undecaprenyl-diphosphatase
MDLIVQAVVMGIVQGLTEFLPISSSGHLIIFPTLMGWTDPFLDSLAFAVMLHLGTLIALVVAFWADWVRLARALVALIRERSYGTDPDRRVVVLLALTVIPGAVLGALLNDFFEREVRAVGLVAVMLVVGAVILWLADQWGAGRRQMEELSAPAAFGIGLAQAAALIPGISRSGISISAGLFAGLTRESAVRFSFLMSGPIIAGAVLFEARKLVGGDSGLAGNVGPLVAGVVAAFVSGILAIRFLLRYVRRHSFTVFVAYRLVLAAVVAIWWLR